MPPLPKPTDIQFIPPPAGTHLAICYRVIDLGTQKTSYMGQEKRQHKILVSWELPDERIPNGEKAGEPFTIHQRYTWSMSEKAALRQDLEAWRGLAFKDEDFGQGGFNIQNIINKPCLLTIVHKSKDDKVYANIAGISKLPKGMTAPDFSRNDPQFCWLNADEFNREVFDSLSDNLKAAIMSSPEYGLLANGSAEHVGEATDSRPTADLDFDDSIPF